MSTVSVSIKDAVATLTLDCGATCNAIDITIIRSFHAALDRL